MRADLSARLEHSLSFFDDASDQYFEAASNSELSSLCADEVALPNVTQAEMIWLYDRKFAGGRSRGRAIYNDLLMGPRNGVCPYCGDRERFCYRSLAAKDPYASLRSRSTKSGTDLL